MARLSKGQLAAIINEYETFTEDGKDELMRFLQDTEVQIPGYLWETQAEYDNARKNFEESKWTLQEDHQIVVS